ncbi:hypothetical protein MUK42_15405 [Musa troglodytarum]|uniref:Uncharacterized protein n=1 Tax=Musa troglodytarum TaxID=320322 RepID=A0A9E7II38_9LILI|nr:hypothetical protein MUK42_15405 [Musa troglodytarum]URE48177.1 hypothetical protein MUK42_15405 [Musa troglodytarum]
MWWGRLHYPPRVDEIILKAIPVDQALREQGAQVTFYDNDNKREGVEDGARCAPEPGLRQRPRLLYRNAKGEDDRIGRYPSDG